MKCFEIINAGKESQLKLVERPSPALGPGQLRIAIKTFGLNRADLMQRRGLYAPPKGETDIPGLEACGEVIEVDSKVSTTKVGDRVAVLLAAGGYADEVVVSEDLVLPLPDSMSFEEGGGLAETWLTAWSNLFLEAKIQEKSVSENQLPASALIHSGASGVGLSSISLLKSFGHTVFTTVSTDEKAKACIEAGADTVIIYTKQDFVEIVKSAGGVDVILDAVGANYFSKNLACLKRRGHLIMIGLMSGSKVDNLSLSDILMKNLTIQGTTLRSRPIQEKASIIASFRKQVLPKFASGSLKVTIDSVYHLNQIEEATDRMLSNLNQGKIIITWR